MLRFLKYFLSPTYLPIIGICTKPKPSFGKIEIENLYGKKTSVKAGEGVILGDLVYKCPKCELVYTARRQNNPPLRWKDLCTLHKQ